MSVQVPPASSADSSSSRPRVLFVGREGGRLMDNVKYTYLYAVHHNCGFDPVFLTNYRDEYSLLRNAQLPVMLLPKASPQYLHSAALLVVDDFPDKMGPTHLCVQHLPCLQLWHGLPIKKVGFSEIASTVNMNPKKARYLAQNYSGYTAVASTSDWVTEHCFEHIFKAEQFLPFGYPRNDALLMPISKHNMLNVDTELYSRMVQHKKGGGHIAFYMPTFRDTGGDFITDNALNIHELAAFCKQCNILFVAKFHPAIQIESFYGLENFILCKSTSDSYPLLPLTDMLITDYSSVYYDYLLLDKAVIFYPYDLEKYTSKDRALFFDYPSIAHGPIVQNQSEMLACLLEITHGKDSHQEARRAFTEKIHSHKDAGSSQKFCQWITETITAPK